MLFAVAEFLVKVVTICVNLRQVILPERKRPNVCFCNIFDKSRAILIKLIHGFLNKSVANDVNIFHLT